MHGIQVVETRDEEQRCSACRRQFEMYDHGHAREVPFDEANLALSLENRRWNM